MSSNNLESGRQPFEEESEEQHPEHNRQSAIDSYFIKEFGQSIDPKAVSKETLLPILNRLREAEKDRFFRWLIDYDDTARNGLNREQKQPWLALPLDQINYDDFAIAQPGEKQSEIYPFVDELTSHSYELKVEANNHDVTLTITSTTQQQMGKTGLDTVAAYFSFSQDIFHSETWESWHRPCDPELRNRGVTTQLHNAAEEIARRNGAKKLVIATNQKKTILWGLKKLGYYLNLKGKRAAWLLSAYLDGEITRDYIKNNKGVSAVDDSSMMEDYLIKQLPSPTGDLDHK